MQSRSTPGSALALVVIALCSGCQSLAWQEVEAERIPPKVTVDGQQPTRELLAQVRARKAGSEPTGPLAQVPAEPLPDDAPSGLRLSASQTPPAPDQGPTAPHPDATVPRPAAPGPNTGPETAEDSPGPDPTPTNAITSVAPVSYEPRVPGQPAELLGHRQQDGGSPPADPDTRSTPPADPDTRSTPPADPDTRTARPDTRSAPPGTNTGRSPADPPADQPLLAPGPVRQTKRIRLKGFSTDATGKATAILQIDQSEMVIATVGRTLVLEAKPPLEPTATPNGEHTAADSARPDSARPDTARPDSETSPNDRGDRTLVVERVTAQFVDFRDQATNEVIRAR